jgi:hypothetical protein
VEGLFSHTLKTIENEEFVQRHKTSQEAFVRDRKFSCKDLIINLISSNRAGVQVELDRFFKSKDSQFNAANNISKSAFTQARRKLQPTLFRELNQSILEFYREYSSQSSKWKNHRVIAIDGSLLNLPLLAKFCLLCHIPICSVNTGSFLWKALRDDSPNQAAKAMTKFTLKWTDAVG